jgi:radical SAM family uncharacterized protein/radical SAM-linked protein
MAEEYREKMKGKTIPALLPFVKKPSSYLGGEINSVKPDKPHRVSFALCFPDAYEVGTAHFGQQILYHLLNQMENVIAERVFAPGQDMEQQLRTAGLSLFSLETKSPLGEFDVLGFSLLYELNYTNVLLMLDLSGIPFYAAERDDSFPLIIAGGPCMFNPEPVADFFDAIVVGDGESVVAEMAVVLLSVKQDGGKRDKKELLKRWSKIKGVYIPQSYEARYDDRGFQYLVPGAGAEETVVRAIVPALSNKDFPDAPVLPFGKPVHDRLRLEVARGCSRGCRFCQAGMIYRPVRERSVDDVLALAESALRATGYEDLSLLSLSTGDYSGLNCLMEQLVFRYGGNNISVSVPSFRAGSLDQRTMKLIQSVRKTGFTIAPEAGSQRLRDVINKNITEEEITQTVRDAFGLGWNLIKLYFMIGLPTETDRDVEEIIALVRRLSKIGGRRGGRENLHVSVAAFIPKAHTPFQWETQMPLEKTKEKLFFLKKKIASRQIGFKWQNPEVSFMEGVFARGDRRLSKLIETAYSKGCRFDGWSDCFNFKRWMEAAAEKAIDLEFYTQRPRAVSEPLPWAVISSGISREFLLNEREKAYQQQRTPDCRDGDCNQCGICDFSEIAPRLTQPEKEKTVDASFPLPGAKSPAVQRKLEIVYSKTGTARFFGHLEFVNIFLRAINRAKIPVVYSQGFHPMPKAAFPEPLPVGVESEGETLVITVSGDVRPEAVITDLNFRLPEGITINACRFVSESGHKKGLENKTVIYRIESGQAVFDKEKADLFWKAERVLLEKPNKDGLIKTIDLKETVSRLTVLDKNRLIMEIKELPGKKARPADIARVLFGLNEETIKQARIVKVSTL